MAHGPAGCGVSAACCLLSAIISAFQIPNGSWKFRILVCYIYTIYTLK